MRGAWLLCWSLVACASEGYKLPPNATPPTFDGGAFADLLVVFAPGMGGDSPDLGDRALGAADGQVVKLGASGALTLGVTETIVNGEGNDFEVVLGAGGTGDVYVYGSETDSDTGFRYIGTVSPGMTQVDLSTGSLGRAVYIRLVGCAPGESNPCNSDVTVDALRVLFAPDQVMPPTSP